MARQIPPLLREPPECEWLTAGLEPFLSGAITAVLGAKLVLFLCMTALLVGGYLR